MRYIPQNAGRRKEKKFCASRRRLAPKVRYAGLRSVMAGERKAFKTGCADGGEPGKKEKKKKGCHSFSDCPRGGGERIVMTRLQGVFQSKKEKCPPSGSKPYMRNQRKKTLQPNCPWGGEKKKGKKQQGFYFQKEEARLRSLKMGGQTREEKSGSR